MPLRQILLAVMCLAVLVYVAAFALFGERLPPPGESTLLDAALMLRSEGTTWTFTAESPGPVLVEVLMPEGCEKDGRISIRPLHLALRPDPVYEPGEEEEAVLAVPRTGLPPTSVTLGRAGAYVVRMEPIPMAMAHEGDPPQARVRVLREPE